MSDRKKTAEQASKQQKQPRSRPLIVDKVNKIPVVSLAISMGFSQYDKLKASSLTVGDVMTRAEGWALYLWDKVQPIVDRLHEPIGKADKLACNTFDFVEHKLATMSIPLTVEGVVSRYRGALRGALCQQAAGQQQQAKQQQAQ